MNQQVEHSSDEVQTLQSGPIPNHQRQTQDICCLIFYTIIFLFGVAAVTTAIIGGNFHNLSRAAGQKNTCGDPYLTEEYPYAYFHDLTGELTHKKVVCVKQCPENKTNPDCFDNFDCKQGIKISQDQEREKLDTQLIENRLCLPKESEIKDVKNSKQIQNKLAKSLGLTQSPSIFNFFLDLTNSYLIIAVSVGAILLISLFIRSLLNCMEKASILHWGVIFFMGGTFFMGIMFLYCGGLLGNDAKFLSYEIDEIRPEYGIGGIFIAMGLFSVGLLFYLYCGKIFKNDNFQVKFVPKKTQIKVYPINNDEQLEEEQYDQESKCFDGLCSITICSTIFICIVWATALVISILLASAVQYDRSSKDLIFLQPQENQKNGQIQPFIYITIGWAIWTQFIITALSRSLITYRLNLNYFEGMRILGRHPRQGILRILLRYHLGSIIMGAFFAMFVTPFEYLRWIFDLGKKDSSSNRKCFHLLSVGSNAYPFMTLYGTSFMQSSRIADDVLWKGSLNNKEKIRARKVVSGLWKWGITCFMLGFIILVLIKVPGVYKNIREPIYFIFIILMMGLGIMEVWTQAYEAKAETMVICQVVSSKGESLMKREENS